MKVRSIAGAVVIIVIGSSGGACGQKKVAECNALVSVINASVTGLEKVPKNESDGTSELKAMADAMDKIAANANAIQLSQRDLKKFRDDYQKMAKEIAKAERDLAKAAEDRDSTRRTAAETAPDAAVSLRILWSIRLTGIARVCRSGPRLKLRDEAFNKPARIPPALSVGAVRRCPLEREWKRDDLRLRVKELRCQVCKRLGQANGDRDPRYGLSALQCAKRGWGCHEVLAADGGTIGVD